MTVLTKKQVLRQFEHAKDEDLFCVYCYELLLEQNRKLYCPNEMCMNEIIYNLKGKEIDGENLK